VWKRKHEAEEITKEQLDTASKACEQLYEAVRNLLQKCEQDAFIKQGEVNAFKFQLDLVESQYNVEGEKAKALLQAVKDSDSLASSPHSRSVGVHPGYSIADIRRVKESTPAVETSSPQSIHVSRRKKTSI
jgi:hypothetical protein